MDKTSKLRKGVGIALNVLTYLFFAICIFALVMSISAKKDADGAVNLFGRQIRVVVSDSMEKCDETDVSGFDIGDIPVRSMIFIELVPENESEAEEWYANLKEGDVLTFRYVYVTQETITHRITEPPVKNERGGYTIKLEGDNKSSNGDTLSQVIDTSLTNSPNYIIGKVTGQSYPLGLLVTIAKSPIGIICMIIIPCLIIAIFEILRLVNALTEGKRKLERDEKEAREREFEEMKRQLELLKKQNEDKNDTDSDN